MKSSNDINGKDDKDDKEDVVDSKNTQLNKFKNPKESYTKTSSIPITKKTSNETLKSLDDNIKIPLTIKEKISNIQKNVKKEESEIEQPDILSQSLGDILVNNSNDQLNIPNSFNTSLPHNFSKSPSFNFGSPSKQKSPDNESPTSRFSASPSKLNLRTHFSEINNTNKIEKNRKSKSSASKNDNSNEYLIIEENNNNNLGNESINLKIDDHLELLDLQGIQNFIIEQYESPDDIEKLLTIHHELNDLLSHIAFANVEDGLDHVKEIKKLLSIKPEWLFKAGNTVLPSGHVIKDIKPYELFLLLYPQATEDNKKFLSPIAVMLHEIFKDTFSKVEGGEIQMNAQFLHCKPYIKSMLSESKSSAAEVKIKNLYKCIRDSTAEVCHIVSEKLTNSNNEKIDGELEFNVDKLYKSMRECLDYFQPSLIDFSDNQSKQIFFKQTDKSEKLFKFSNLITFLEGYIDLVTNIKTNPNAPKTKRIHQDSRKKLLWLIYGYLMRNMPTPHIEMYRSLRKLKTKHEHSQSTNLVVSQTISTSNTDNEKDVDVKTMSKSEQKKYLKNKYQSMNDEGQIQTNALKYDLEKHKSDIVSKKKQSEDKKEPTRIETLNNMMQGVKKEILTIENRLGNITLMLEKSSSESTIASHKQSKSQYEKQKSVLEAKEELIAKELNYLNEEVKLDFIDLKNIRNDQHLEFDIQIEHLNRKLSQVIMKGELEQSIEGYKKNLKSLSKDSREDKIFLKNLEKANMILGLHEKQMGLEGLKLKFQLSKISNPKNKDYYQMEILSLTEQISKIENIKNTSEVSTRKPPLLDGGEGQRLGYNYAYGPDGNDDTSGTSLTKSTAEDMIDYLKQMIEVIKGQSPIKKINSSLNKK